MTFFIGYTLKWNMVDSNFPKSEEFIKKRYKFIYNQIKLRICNEVLGCNDYKV